MAGEEEMPVSTAQSSRASASDGSSDDEEHSSPARKRTRESHESGGKEPAQVEQPSSDVPVHPWQAIWSSEANAFYFWNKDTSETTWTNPLGTEKETETGGKAIEATEPEPLQSNGLDPELAYLDPAQYRTVGDGSSAARAKFDTKTGRFIPIATAQAVPSTSDEIRRPVNRAPDFVSEYARGNRMMSAYFDVDEWKRQQEEAAASGQDDYKPTKKDITRFKQKKLEKKKAKQRAWLLD